MLEDVRAAVYARAFAVPDAEHPIEPVGAGRCKAQLLGAPQGGSGQFFIHARLKDDVLDIQVVFGFPQRLVVITQWRAPVATDEPGGVFALQGIALALQHGQLDQGLHAAHEGPADIQAVFVVQCDRFEGLANRVWQWRVHGVSCK